MTAPTPPTWDEIRAIIERADEVCRESEHLRDQFERARQRPEFWPDRRQPARAHERGHVRDRRGETGSTPEGNQGTL